MADLLWLSDAHADAQSRAINSPTGSIGAQSHVHSLRGLSVRGDALRRARRQLRFSSRVCHHCRILGLMNQHPWANSG